MKGPILYFLVTNSLHQDQRLQRICSTLAANNYQINLVGINNSSKHFQSSEFNCISLSTIFKSGPLFYAEVNFRFLMLLLFRKLDGIVANDLDTLMPAKLLCYLRSKTLFIDLHEYFTEVPELNGKDIKKKFWTRIGKFGITKSSCNYTVNENLANILGKKYEVHFESIYNYPISYESDNIPRDYDQIRLVYVGKVNAGRGLVESISAIKEFDNISLTIIGDGDEISKIRKLISDKGLQSKIIMKGFITPDLIREELSIYDLGLNILHADSLNYYYSSANKFFDYIMAGLPSISMDFPEYKKCNDQYETSILINQCTIENIKTELQKILEDKTIITQMRRNCFKARNEYNWNSQKAKVLTIYNEAFNL